ncbi:MAG: LytR/AlgR family response regulator transcription factor [Lachnospiraceae bacterium]
MKIVICDDMRQDALAGKQLFDNNYSNMDITCEIMKPKELLLMIEENMFSYDLAIMDIEFGDEEFDGIKLSQKINEIAPSCQIIYLTSFLEFAPDVYETKHCYFVMKPNLEVMLPRAFKKAYDFYLSEQKQDILEIVCDGQKTHLLQKEIVYVEREGRMLRIHMDEEEYVCYMSIRKILKELSPDFARCHGGYIVNLGKIIAVNSEMVTVETGEKIDIGRTFYDSFMESYLKYYSKQI